MAMDTFICGSCQMTFNDIEQFVIHKKDCNVNLLSTAAQQEPQGNGQDEGQVVVTTADSNAENQVMAFPEGSRVISTEMVDALTGEQQTVIIIQSAQGAEVQGSMPGVSLTPQTPATGKKRGRPKKEKSEVSTPAVKVEKVEKPSTPDMGADGKLYCKACKKSFHKERFFKTHKCMPTTDYVDITKKSVLAVEYGENEEAASEEDEEELDNDEDKDFKVSDYKIKDVEEEEEDEIEEEEDDDEAEGPPKKKRRAYKLRMDADGEERGARPTDQIGDVPIFKTEAEKSQFEQSLNVDLSFVDNMFRQHMIEQDLNDQATVASRMTTNTLNLYSCNMCDKIFKTLSHMRLHCLTHTDAKPFKCPKCPYRSNGKGNLYTHMRKHTGQFFRCKVCDFKSVNKSHVLEHEAVHSNVRHQCDICKKDYNTLKSLINHIRKYHKNSGRGEEYLSSFLQGGRQRGATVIHQCHVCNRKFKKKIDRDRHLYVHDIKDIPTIQMCSLCDYTASRKVYLEKHFQKHRVIYKCVKCEDKFLSTIRLIDHLTTSHIQDDETTKWESMFEECINNSLYLPEPDEMLSSAEKEFVSLPAELSQTNIEGKARVEVEQMPEETSGAIEAMKTEQKTIQEENLQMNETDANSKSKDMETEDSLPNKDGSAEGVLKDGLPNETSDDLSSTSNVDNTVSEDNPLGENEDARSSSGKDEKVLSSTNESNLTPVEENDEEEENPKEDKVDSADLIKTLGYRPLTLQIFHKMRETFGHEECEYCGKLYYNKIDYDQHIRTHTGDNPYPCSICGFRALTRDGLQSHKAKEHEKMSFPCKECSFTANSRSQLWNHSLVHSGFGEDMGIECPECQQKIGSLSLFKEHVNEVHPESKNKELVKLHIYAGLETSPKHKVQGKIGRRSYKCPYCDKMFIRANSELQKHIWIHEGVKPFKCPLCPHACRSKNNLQAHMLRHSNEKPYTCSECNKAYKSKTALRWHVRSHKAGRLFKCTKCPYEATQAAHLRRHMEIHNVIKKYACQHCSYTANTLSYLKVHHTRSHKGLPYKNVDVPVVEETGIGSSGASQVYRCLSCDYLFGNLTDLKRHLKIRHHLTLTNFVGLDGEKGISNLSEQPLTYSEETVSDGMITEEGHEGSVPVISAVQTIDATSAGVNSSNLDEKTASAVNILQQIFGMSQQSSGGQQQFTIQSETGEVMTVNPETIIVQEGDEQVLVTDGNQPEGGHQQYVIQYVNQEQIENSMVEIQTIQDVQHFQTIEQEIIQSMDTHPLGDNVVEHQIVQS